MAAAAAGSSGGPPCRAALPTATIPLGGPRTATADEGSGRTPCRTWRAARRRTAPRHGRPGCGRSDRRPGAPRDRRMLKRPLSGLVVGVVGRPRGVAATCNDGAAQRNKDSRLHDRLPGRSIAGPLPCALGAGHLARTTPTTAAAVHPPAPDSPPSPMGPNHRAAPLARRRGGASTSRAGRPRAMTISRPSRALAPVARTHTRACRA